MLTPAIIKCIAIRTFKCVSIIISWNFVVAFGRCPGLCDRIDALLTGAYPVRLTRIRSDNNYKYTI